MNTTNNTYEEKKEVTVDCRKCTHSFGGIGSIYCEFCDPPFTSQFEERKK